MLYLGNVGFDESKMDSKTPTSLLEKDSSPSIKKIATFLGLDEAQITKRLTTASVRVEFLSLLF